MINVEQLLEQWESTGHSPLTIEPYPVQLSPSSNSFLSHIQALYPRLSRQQILQDLLTLALDKVEAGMPYIKGTKVVGTDEEGDPIYEDIGKTPAFLALTQKHHARLLELQQAG
jgi:hypothetical protein